MTKTNMYFIAELNAYIEDCEIQENYEKQPKPAYYFVYELTVEGKKVETTQSNCSGSISPYYFVDENTNDN